MISLRALASFVIVQHVFILGCMYVCTYVSHAWVWGAISYASAARVSRGYMVCARARDAWLHGLRTCRMHMAYGYMVCLDLALPRVAGSESFNAVAFTSNDCLLYFKMPKRNLTLQDN